MYERDNKIMLIDNDNSTNQLIKFFFEKEDDNVDSFTNAIEALQSFSKGKYDLLLIDFKIPKLNEVSVYNKFEEIDSKVSICLKNANTESL